MKHVFENLQWAYVRENLHIPRETMCRIPSLLLGARFVSSGWLKGVVPYGTSLKLSEYFCVWAWSGFVTDNPLAWSVCFCAWELYFGLLYLLFMY